MFKSIIILSVCYFYSKENKPNLKGDVGEEKDDKKVDKKVAEDKKVEVEEDKGKVMSCRVWIWNSEMFMWQVRIIHQKMLVALEISSVKYNSIKFNSLDWVWWSR